MKFLILFLSVLPLLGATDYTTGRNINLSGKKILLMDQWQIRMGDQLEWAVNPGEDSSWKPVIFKWPPPEGDQTSAQGNFWLQTTITLQGKKDETYPLMLFFIQLPSAFEIFWDGIPFARNGRVGKDRREETPGKIRGFILLPIHKTTSGPHRLSIRVSNFHIHKKNHDFELLCGYSSVLNELTSQRKEENLLYMGLFLTAALFSLFLFLGGWRYFPAIFFSAFTFFHFFINFWYYLLRSNALKVSLYYWLNPVFTSAGTISFLLLNIFLLWHLEIPRRKVFSGILCVSSLLHVVSPFLFRWEFWHSDLIVAFVMLALIFQQFRRKKTGSATALLGYSFFLFDWLAYLLLPLLPVLAFLDEPFISLLAYSIFLVGLMGSVTLKMREQFRTLDALRFRSQRLEAELLKKYIQPHFIMNTLQSIKSFLGRDSAKAEKLIETLAGEFRLINRISGEMEIPLEEELRLCRLHLELMGYRRDANYQLLTDGDCLGFSIPPMVLHTLIENGLTHAFKPKENGNFRFHCQRKGHKTVYRLENDGSNLAEMLKGSSAHIEEGMGMKYVRARLAEAYAGKWRLDYGLARGIWFVQIEKEDG
ncbi:MAG: sensor histidine kinase [Candidatus Aminicenantes bacterium]|nr:sensor histidine kinase [Candidatus Aminicenantes bacterium]